MSLPSTPTPVPATNHLMARADPGTAIELSLVVTTQYYHTMAPAFRRQPQRHPPRFCPPLQNPHSGPKPLNGKSRPWRGR